MTLTMEQNIAEFSPVDDGSSQFREQVRSWLADHFPASLRNVNVARAAATQNDLPAIMKDWSRRLGKTGWGAAEWPTQYGGAGLSKAQALIVEEEMALVGAGNPIGRIGLTMLGQTLLHYGTEAQKLKHLPPIARGETLWCQGYSEPGAGSDLASLQLAAEDKGDHFVVNGQKVWTSNAHTADWIFCLVRTDRSQKHGGISFLLIDMQTAGVEVRPIVMISGDSDFSEVFFSDVVVPKENLVGELNGGWAIARYLLQFERQMITREGGGGQSHGGDVRPIEQIAMEYVGAGPDHRLNDGDLRHRLSSYLMTEQAFTLTRKRVTENPSAAAATGSASILKSMAAEVVQTRAELLLEIVGYQGFGWSGEGFSATELESTRVWLAGKSSSLAGGTSEIQNNIVATRILKLPV